MDMACKSVLIVIPLFTVTAACQTFSMGLMGGAGLTEDFQDYNLLPFEAPPGTNVTIRGASYPQHWIAGGTLEVRLPLHLAIEADALYHELRFKAGVQFGQTPVPWGRAFYQHVVTWEFPVLLKYRFDFHGVKPFVNAGPAFRNMGNLSHTNPSSVGVAAGLGVETRVWRLRLEPQFRYIRWARDRDVPMFGLTTVRNQVEFLTGILFP